MTHTCQDRQTKETLPQAIFGMSLLCRKKRHPKEQEWNEWKSRMRAADSALNIKKTCMSTK